MNEFFNVYSLIVCIVVLSIFVPLCVYVIWSMTKQTVRLIEYGHEDESVKKYFENEKKRKQSCLLNGAFRGLILVATVLLIGFTIFCAACEGCYSDKIALPKVVMTDSMATKHSKNKYLFENDLDNQINTFDLIFISKVPAEEELKLYDIAVYEIDGVQVVHRIVEIREATEDSPRKYIFQGDALKSPDSKSVTYDQIKGIYTGVKVPFVGSFIVFMKSTAGYLCALLIIVGLIAAPIVDGKIEKAGEKRYAIILAAESKKKILAATAQSESVAAESNPPPDEIAASENAPPQDEGEILGNTNEDGFAAFAKKQKVSFVNRLLAAEKETQERFNALHNQLLSYKKVNGRTSFKCMSYRLGKKLLAKITLRGKTLRVYLALDLEAFNKNVYFQKDASEIKAYQQVPFMVKVKSDRSEKNVKKLIDALMEKEKVVKKVNFTPANLVEEYTQNKGA